MLSVAAMLMVGFGDVAVVDAAELAGAWRIEAPSLIATPKLVTMTHTGATVRFEMDVDGGYHAVFTGTVSGSVVTFGAIGGVPCNSDGRLEILPGDDVMDGRFTVFQGICSPTAFRLVAKRCGCADGNTTDGDGCDALCQIEPCWSCGGAPSVCTPSADGAACDDRRDCTAGTTCAAGACGGGSAVPACIDLTGRWLITSEHPILGTLRGHADVSQHEGVYTIGSPPGRIGTIDTATGAMHSSVPSTQLLCTVSQTFDGTAAPDGRAWTGGGAAWAQTATNCVAFDYTEQASRCGGGLLDAGEACDDGNDTAGDGCDASCAVEPCWTCEGEPSTCARATEGTSCGGGSTCNAEGACVCAPGICGPCRTCDAALGCIAAPREDCRASLSPTKARLDVRDGEPSLRDAVDWTWPKGATTTRAELGDPTASSSVDVCVFGASSDVLLSARVPAGGTCGGKPCWRGTAKGFTYADGTGAADGITKLQLVAGAAGKAKALVRGKGAALEVPTPPLELPLRVQLQVEGGACFESVHDAAGVRRNEAGVFKATGTP